MRVLVINCGSSSLKFELIAFGASADDEARLAEGNIGGIGARATIRAGLAGRMEPRDPVDMPDHGAAARWAIEWLGAHEPSMRAPPDGVGHRVVHGGPRLFAPAVVDPRVLREITAAGELAPLHNGGALDAIAATRALLGDSVPTVAVFDTAFHHHLPDRAARYAIAPDAADRHGIRRYGFHGLAHRYMAGRAAAMLDRPDERLRLITLQLGSGCSAAAIRGGRPLDTSMGFSPLEGLVMATRSGDIDPSVVRYLCERERMTPDDVDEWLNRRCGLLGVSGASDDVRELLRLESRGDPRAALALELFCYRLRKYIGAYLAVLGGADAVVFGGGIGENAAEIRARTCRDMDWSGLRLDETRNARVAGEDGAISAEGSRIRALVIRVDEEILIARDTRDCLLSRRDTAPADRNDHGGSRP